MKNIGKNAYFYVTCLAVILFLSIILKSYGFIRPHIPTTDEVIYYRLGAQLAKDVGDYSAQHIIRDIREEQGRPTEGSHSSYRLFKHPPLYSYLIALSFKVLGKSPLSAFSVSLLFGSLTILVVFLLGVKIYNANIGLLAAFLLAIDPIHWICSRKVWSGTTLSFFMALSLLLFLLGKDNRKYLFFSGISLGLAMLTKYTAGLAFLIFFLYIYFFEKDLANFKRFFFVSCMSFLAFFPWIIWNYIVFGKEFLFRNLLVIQRLRKHLINLEKNYILIILLLVSACVLYKIVKKLLIHIPMSKICEEFMKNKIVKLGILLLIIIITLLYLPSRRIIINLFNWKFIPSFGYTIGMLYNEPWYFYFERILYYSGLYLLGFLYFFNPHKDNKREKLLFIWLAVILLFSTLWGNYQSRYIIIALPALVLLAAQAVFVFYNYISEKFSGWQALIYKGMFFIYLAFFLLKTIRIDIVFSMPNQMVYF